jgi:hypothetical protein
MSRRRLKARRDRRGRPRQAQAKRRQTTVAGRRGEPDTGTAELRRRKRRATGREDLELTGAAVLFAHDHLDRQQYDTLGVTTELLRRIARAWGRDGSVPGPWDAITSALVTTGYVAAPVTADIGFALADNARKSLAQALRQLDGSRDLVIALAEGGIPDLILHVLEHKVTEQDTIALERLRLELDRISGQRRRSADLSN